MQKRSLNFLSISTSLADPPGTRTAPGVSPSKAKREFRTMKRTAIAAAALVLLSSAKIASAQAVATSATDHEKTVERLEHQLRELTISRERDERRIRELEEGIQAPTSASADSAPAEERGAFSWTGQGNLLNPQITAFLDIGGSWSSDGDNAARNRFNFREAELDLRAAVTPRADGVLTLAFGEQVENPFGTPEVRTVFEVEEGYLDVHTLPFDLALRAGKFRSAFGRNNLLHLHDLPQVTRPLANQAFFGPEGIASVGASLSWIVPNPWDQYIEFSTDVVNADSASESPVVAIPGADNPAVLSHLKFFEDVGETGSVELGTSFLYSRASGGFEDGFTLGADATYHWLDPARPDFRSFLLQGELFWSRSSFSDGSRGDDWGLYVFGQFQLARSWYTGVRYDYTEYPGLDDRRGTDADWAISPYVTWYLFESLRLRLEYQHLERDHPHRAPTEDSILLGLTFYIGAHPPHPYWVNR